MAKKRGRPKDPNSPLHAVRAYCERRVHWWASGSDAALWVFRHWRILELRRQYKYASLRQYVKGLKFTKQPFFITPPQKEKALKKKFTRVCASAPDGYYARHCACPHSHFESHHQDYAFTAAEYNKMWMAMFPSQHVASVFILDGVPLSIGSTYSCNLCGGDITGWLLSRSKKFFKGVA